MCIIGLPAPGVGAITCTGVLEGENWVESKKGCSSKALAVGRLCRSKAKHFSITSISSGTNEGHSTRASVAAGILG